MNTQVHSFLVGATIFVALSACQPATAPEVAQGPEFSVSFDASLSESAQDGRLVVLLSSHEDDEPRFLVSNSADTQLIFGQNVEKWQSGDTVVVDHDAIGFPLKDLTHVPPGTYYAQALLNRYKDFHLSNGKVVSLSPDQGEGQRWNRKPGNFYSKPVQIVIGEATNEAFELILDQEIPPIEPPADTQYIKHIQMKSELLSEF
ncbi:MAG: hypothetical protein HOI35_13620, partial [Woeseia sp.]|nr:hypothetical protein [Woeseia sp.]